LFFDLCLISQFLNLSVIFCSLKCYTKVSCCFIFYLSCLVFCDFPGFAAWCLTLIWEKFSHCFKYFFCPFLLNFYNIQIAAFLVIPQFLNILFYLLFGIFFYLFFSCRGFSIFKPRDYFLSLVLSTNKPTSGIFVSVFGYLAFHFSSFLELPSLLILTDCFCILSTLSI
jgi:hypothetical protein